MDEHQPLPPRPIVPRDDYYMGEAFNILARSKDPSTQVGARLVSQENEPLGTGYNGPPKGIDDYTMDWSRPAKYHLIRHAEVNAIKYSRGNTKGATIYVTAPPCPACMLAIVDAEIARVVYFPPPPSRDSGSMTKDPQGWANTQEISKRGGVRLEKFSGDLTWMLDHVSYLKNLGIFGDDA